MGILDDLFGKGTRKSGETSKGKPLTDTTGKTRRQRETAKLNDKVGGGKHAKPSKADIKAAEREARRRKPKDRK